MMELAKTLGLTFISSRAFKALHKNEFADLIKFTGLCYAGAIGLQVFNDMCVWFSTLDDRIIEWFKGLIPQIF